MNNRDDNHETPSSAKQCSRRTFLYTVALTTGTVYDAQVTGGLYSVEMHFWSEDGVSNTTDLPTFSVFNNAGLEIVTNALFTNFAWPNAETLAASNKSWRLSGARRKAVSTFDSASENRPSFAAQ